MKYKDVLNWIHGQLTFGIKPGIDRMKWVLEQLGNPQDNIFAIHVVGTNGKGSTVNNLQHILTNSGYHVGTFTSPYIVDFKERISVDGQMIPEEDLVTCAELIKPLTDRIAGETDFGEVTEFELITLIMFLYFGRLHPVDIAIIEAGLGGRFDSTNLFNAFAVICPSIGLDHLNILGDTYSAIAEQKAGVIKGSEAVIFAIDNQEARQVFLDKIAEKKAVAYEYGHEFNLSPTADALEFTSQLGKISQLELAMPGQHQLSNASLSIMAAQLLQEKMPKITDKAIRKGLKEAFWLGRTELLADNLMIDGAHNKESVLALVDVVKEHYADKRIHLLFGAIDTKPIDDMLKLLETVGDVRVTSFRYPNAYPLEKYPERFERCPDFKAWLANIDLSSQSDFYLVTGSLYFISEVRQYWKLEKDKG
ncbi:bifunctional folylpolyglutamate synthase/dihydrofolate synthase [Streptococcus hongkongensis]|nr:dihydrofolate synthase [Streptococcus uberis]